MKIVEKLRTIVWCKNCDNLLPCCTCNDDDRDITSVTDVMPTVID